MTGRTLPSRRGRWDGQDLDRNSDRTAAGGHPGFADLLAEGPWVESSTPHRGRYGRTGIRRRSHWIDPDGRDASAFDDDVDDAYDDQLSTPGRRRLGLLLLAVIAAGAAVALSPEGMDYTSRLLSQWLP